jgi:hypothetical protein
MTAHLSYDNVLTLQSESDDEAEDLGRFISEGNKHGYFTVGTACSFDGMTAHVGIKLPSRGRT